MTATDQGIISAPVIDGIVLTDEAASKVKALLDGEGRDDLALRVAVQPGGCSGLRYQLFFDERSLDGDIVKDFSGVNVVTDRMSAPVPDGRDHRLRRHDREAGLHDRQPERHRVLRLRRQLPLSQRRDRATAARDRDSLPRPSPGAGSFVLSGTAPVEAAHAVR